MLPEKIIGFLKSKRFQQIASVFLIVIGLFVCVEILPLHFGAKQLPWPEVITLVQKRIPIMLLIALAVAIATTMGKKSE